MFNYTTEIIFYLSKPLFSAHYSDSSVCKRLLSQHNRNSLASCKHALKLNSDSIHSDVPFEKKREKIMGRFLRCCSRPIYLYYSRYLYDEYSSIVDIGH